MKIKFYRQDRKANALILSIVLVALGTGLIIAFMSRSINMTSLTGIVYDTKDSNYRMEAALEKAEAKLKRAITGIRLNGKLQYAGGPSSETFNGISNAYVEDNTADGKVSASSFLSQAIVAQSYSSTGVQDTAHEFSNFIDCDNSSLPTCAFPSEWTDPDPTDNDFYEVKYSFYPLPTKSTLSPATITFEYEYLVQIRAFGKENFSTSESEISGIISIPMMNAPFSRWAIILNELKNQNGSTLVFAGGNTSAQFQEYYNGPVHVNGKGNFYGHPIFNDTFSSGVAFSSWGFWNTSTYSGCQEKYGAAYTQCFRGGYEDSADTITYPSELFNTLRLAAGDTSATAATNTSTVSEAELIALLQENQNGTLGAITTLPDGIYIPINDQVSKNIEGGIFVRGDAQMQMDVIVDPSTEIVADHQTSMNAVNADHQNCRFQKIDLSNIDTGEDRIIFIGDEPKEGAPSSMSADDCAVTYVFNGADATEVPQVLSGRINGNVYVEGSIDELGGASRTRPAVARDFGFHLTALKDIRIINDLQYEDAKYYAIDSNGETTGSPVADPFGELNSSGILPTAAELGPVVDSNSKTILGLTSLKRNIKIHLNAPGNINLHGALYAGNDEYYNSSTGLGCNANNVNKKGCGWGVEGWNTVTGKGSVKILGSIAEYRDQTTGMLSSTPTGYEQIFFYDSRLLSSLQPPGFPISNDFQATPVITRFKAFRVSKAD